MKIIIDVSEYTNEINKLERLYYEIEARTKIISSMIKENSFESDENFNKYWESYLEHLKVFNMFKAEFYTNYLNEYKEGTWELDFVNKQVTINTED